MFGGIGKISAALKLFVKIKKQLDEGAEKCNAEIENEQASIHNANMKIADLDTFKLKAKRISKLLEEFV